MADTTRNIFSLSEYSDDTVIGDGIPLTEVNTGLAAKGAV